MMEKDELIASLKTAKKRNPDAWNIIGAVSGLGEKAVKDIATGKREPTMMELSMLGTLAGA